MKLIALYHRKSVSEQGWSLLRVLPSILLGLIVLNAVAYFLFDLFARERDITFLILWVGGQIFVVGFMAITGYVQLISDGVFECYLDATEIRQEFPFAGRMSFRLRLDQLVKIEHEPDEGDKKWFLCTKEGERFELSQSYDNPRADFLDAIRRLRPDLSEGEREFGAPLFFWPWTANTKPPKS